MKKRVLILFIIIVVLFAGTYFDTHKKHIYFDDENIASLLNYSFIVDNTENIDKILTKKSFIYSTDDRTKYIAIITFAENKGVLNQYKVSVGETIDLSLKKGENFIISLPISSLSADDWEIINSLSIAKLYDSTRIEIPFKASNNLKNYERRNLYFKLIQKGDELIDLKYTPINNENYLAEEIKINVEIM